MEVKLSEYQYPEIMGTFARPAPNTAGIFLGDNPQDFPSFFLCPCGRELYDGGICSAVHCSCGEWVKRTEDNQVCILSGEPVENKWKSRGFAEALNLTSATFGLFSCQLHDKYKRGHKPDYPKILSSVLRDFFQKRLRCIEENLIFSYKNLKFKVLACEPRQGFIVKSTRLHLDQNLLEDPLKHIEILPLQPHTIPDEIFESAFLPYFTQQEIHLHQGQHISIYGLDCVVVKSKPLSGYVLAEVTEFTYSENFFPFITKVELMPYVEDLPTYFNQVSMAQMTKMVVDFYLMPYFLGWNRILKQGQVLEIGGIDFKVTQCEPAVGVVGAFSKILFDGSTVSRRRNLHLAHEIQMLQDVIGEIEENMQSREQRVGNIPDFVMKSLPSDIEQKNCVICLSDFEVGCKVRVFTCCKRYLGHIFHKSCSEKWLVRNMICPICKTEIKC